VPKALGYGQKFHYADLDTQYIEQIPPEQNNWYEVFTDEDVRLLLCVIRQTNTEAAAKEIQIRWTIDGNVYWGAVTAANNTLYYVFRDQQPSNGGTAGLSIATSWRNACFYVDKRGINFSVEVRLTSVPGTNQILNCWCVKETLEIT